MADSSIPITPGSGANVDTRTTTNGDHREVVVLGDGATDNVATILTSGSRNALDVNLASSQGGAAAVTQAVSTTAASSATGTASTTAMAVAAVSAAGNATIALYGGTYTALTLNFEACPEASGTYWVPIDGARTDGSTVDVSPSFTAAGVRAWNIIAPGYQFVRVRVSAITQTAAPTVLITQGPFLYDPSPIVAPLDGQKWTYSAGLNAAGTVGIANALDQWVIQNPAASGRLLRVTHIGLAVSLATAAAGIVQLTKRIALNTGGTVIANSVTRHDTSDPASVVTTIGTYSAAPTGSGASFPLRQARMNLPVSPGVSVEWYFGNRPARGIVLRPGEQLGALVLSATGAAPATAPTVTGDVEWTEELAA